MTIIPPWLLAINSVCVCCVCVVCVVCVLCVCVYVFKHVTTSSDISAGGIPPQQQQQQDMYMDRKGSQPPTPTNPKQKSIRRMHTPIDTDGSGGIVLGEVMTMPVTPKNPLYSYEENNA